MRGADDSVDRARDCAATRRAGVDGRYLHLVALHRRIDGGAGRRWRRAALRCDASVAGLPARLCRRPARHARAGRGRRLAGAAGDRCLGVRRRRGLRADHAGVEPPAGEDHAARAHGADVLDQADRRACRRRPLAGLIVPPLTVAFGWQTAIVVVAAICVAVADRRRNRCVRRSTTIATAARDCRRRRCSAACAGRALPALRTMALVSFFYSGMQMSVAGFIVAYLSHRDRLSGSSLRARH